MSYEELIPFPSYEETVEEVYFPSYDDEDEAAEAAEDFEIENAQFEPLDSSYTSKPLLYVPSSTWPIERHEDDSAAREQPTRHVDYLSHDWTEEDVWCSYKLVKENRKMYPNSVRLENAAWRTWEQKRRNLSKTSPETVKWLKDHDVTWLYGPLQPWSCPLKSHHNYTGAVDKKPCLKRRTLSEIMLLRSGYSRAMLPQPTPPKACLSPSDSCLLRRSDRPGLSRSVSSASSTNSVSTPDSERSAWFTKNVRFHEKVEQCIALAHVGEDDHHLSDDESIVMVRKPSKTTTFKQRPALKAHRTRSPSKTIEKLPHVPLKSSEPHNTEVVGLGITTPRPIFEPIDGFFGDEVAIDEDEDCEPPAWLQGRKNSIQIFQEKLDALKLRSEEDAALSNSLFLAPSLSGTEDPASPQTGLTLDLPSFSPEIPSFSFNDFSGSLSPESEEGGSWSADADNSTAEGSDFSPMSSDSADGFENVLSVAPLSAAKTDLVNRVMAEFWIVFNAQDYNRSPAPVMLSTPASLQPRKRTWSLSSTSSVPEVINETPISRALAEHEQSLRQTLPVFVRKKVVDLIREEERADEAFIISRLAAIIQDCQEKVLAAYQAEDYISGMPPVQPVLAFAQLKAESLSTASSASDSGYGTDADRVRDVREEEKEKGIKGWEMYGHAWDDEEAQAWERAF